MKKNILLLLLLTFAALGSKAQDKIDHEGIRKQNIKFYSKLADTAYAEQDYGHAFAMYETLVGYDPTNGKAYRRMGYVMWMAVNENENALKYTKKALEINPKDDGALLVLGLVYIKMAKAGDKVQNKALAEQALKESIALGNEAAKETIKELDAL